MDESLLSVLRKAMQAVLLCVSSNPGYTQSSRSNDDLSVGLRIVVYLGVPRAPRKLVVRPRLPEADFPTLERVGPA